MWQDSQLAATGQHLSQDEHVPEIFSNSSHTVVVTSGL